MMRTVVLASELQATQTKRLSQTLEIVLVVQERTLARVEISVQEKFEDKDKFVAPERTAPTTEVVPISTLVQNTLQASQHIPATPTNANTMLLLTAGLKFDKIASRVILENAKSLILHTKKLP